MCAGIRRATSPHQQPIPEDCIDTAYVRAANSFSLSFILVRRDGCSLKEDNLALFGDTKIAKL